MIDRKKAERLIARLRDYDRCNDNDVDEAACMLDALLAERDALARDAARYRWLRENSGWVSTVSPDKGRWITLLGPKELDDPEIDGAGVMDAAIDAAMKGASDE